jgi:CRISPR-associated protein Csb2
MSRHLALSFRFLSPWFHGRGDEGLPEWPPSPLRAFQALVAAAARAGALPATRSALTWLEQQPSPLIMGPLAMESAAGYQLSVPHNAMDLVGKQWSRGDEGSASEHRTMKSVRPSRLPDEAVVHYAWPLVTEESAAEALIAAARGVVALGWGVDLVVGDGAVIDGAKLAALATSLKTWEPRSDGRNELRVPAVGTMKDLDRRHEAFLARTSWADPTLRPPPALSVFALARYARRDQRPAPEVAAFALMRLDSDNFRAFETSRKGMAVSGMLRHAVRTAAERSGWDEARVRASVLGHGDGTDPRLVLVPIPSVEPRGESTERVGAIRRVMVFSTEARGAEVSWSMRALSGADLVDEKTGEVQAVLAPAARGDRVLRRYLAESSTWTTVTPVVLPGHDDPGGVREKLRRVRRPDEQKALLERLAKRREALVRKALRHAGLGDELAFGAAIETRETGFLSGVEKASRYAVPAHLSTSPRLHVRITWPTAVSGPLCIGRGRFSGLGLLVATT